MPAPHNFTVSYIRAALWSSTDMEGEPLDANFDMSDLSDDLRKKMNADCDAFYDANEAAINCEGAPDASDGTGNDGMAGHDFWLTRSGHGAGFWDGDWPEPHATVLTAACDAFGSFDIYVGDDGKLYA